MTADLHTIRYYRQMYDQCEKWPRDIVPASHLQYIAYLSYEENIYAAQCPEKEGSSHDHQ